MIITNKFNMPEVYCEAIRRKFSRGPTDAGKERKSIAVTTFIDSPFIYYLRRLHASELEMDVIDAFFAFRGQMVHQILEDIMLPNVIKEMWLSVKHKSGMNIGAKIDLILPGEIHDHKIKSVNSAFFFNAFANLTDERQVNIYNWLLYQTFKIKIFSGVNLKS